MQTQKTSRQQAYEQWQTEHHQPVFRAWEQVGPFSGILSVLQRPERDPSSNELYATLSGDRGWQPMQEYVDGFTPQLNLADIDGAVLEKRPTICVARTITAPAEMTLSAYLGADGGFAVSLNGESLALFDKQGEIRPGEELVVLPLRAGDNRLVIKFKLDRFPFRFYFQPDFGEPLTEQLLESLDARFPIEQERPTGFREHARVAATASEDAFYQLSEVPVPEGVALEGGGLAFLPDRRLAVSTRRGFVYFVENVTAPDPSAARFIPFASGLHEALGLHATPTGELVAAQRGGLTKILDCDGDGIADTFRNICNAWGLTGDYHEYTLDLEQDAKGNLYTALCLSDEERRGVSTSNVPWRGWIVQVTPEGEFIPWCFGLRCCNGLCRNSLGDLFATDNQGQWVPASPVHHVRRDHYYGSPPSRRWVEASDSDDARRRAGETPTPPAVWIPYDEFCMSAADLVCDDTQGRFGPFADQLFVADMMKGTIVRVALEKVNGDYQGACFLFRRGVGAVNRMTFGPDHRLYLARASRGWAGAGRSEGLARLEFTGRTPLELESIRLLPDGFALTFTLPLMSDAAQHVADMQIEQFRYEYWEQYHAPKIDRELLSVSEISLSPDAQTLIARVSGLRAGHVCRLSLPRLRSITDEILLHPDAFYTINSLANDERLTATNALPDHRSETEE